MSSGPSTLLDNLTVADGYLDEAFMFVQVSLGNAFPSGLTSDELDDLVLAKDFLRKVIDSVVARNDVTSDTRSSKRS